MVSFHGALLITCCANKRRAAYLVVQYVIDTTWENYTL